MVLLYHWIIFRRNFDLQLSECMVESCNSWTIVSRIKLTNWDLVNVSVNFVSLVSFSRLENDTLATLVCIHHCSAVSVGLVSRGTLLSSVFQSFAHDDRRIFTHFFFLAHWCICSHSSHQSVSHCDALLTWLTFERARFLSGCCVCFHFNDHYFTPLWETRLFTGYSDKTTAMGWSVATDVNSITILWFWNVPAHCWM